MTPVWDILLAIAPYAVGVLATFIGLVVYRLSKLWRLERVLGVDREARRVIVYLSSMFIPGGNAHDFRGMARSYEGIVLPVEEFSAGAALVRLLSIDPFENIPPLIREPLEQRATFFKPLRFDLNASPMREQDIDFSTGSIITAGSHGYNFVTDYTRSNSLSQLRVAESGMSIEVTRGRHKGEVIDRPSNKHDIAQLEKVVDESRGGATIIIAAGLGVIGTMGAIRYLIDNWALLHRQYGEKPFALVLQFGPAGTASLDELLQGAVVRSFPES